VKLTSERIAEYRQLAMDLGAMAETGEQAGFNGAAEYFKDAAAAIIALLALPRALPAPDPLGFEVLLGDRMYVDSSMQYRSGTVCLTIKRKPRESAAAPTESK
jgi:hypothetical protein